MQGPTLILTPTEGVVEGASHLQLPKTSGTPACRGPFGATRVGQGDRKEELQPECSRESWCRGKWPPQAVGETGWGSGAVGPDPQAQGQQWGMLTTVLAHLLPDEATDLLLLPGT